MKLTMKFSSSSSSFILGFFFISLLLQRTESVITLPGNVTIPAVIGFGDSIIDPGNNNNLNTLIKCNFRPYGRDFGGGRPTGRFSNGKIPTDLLAEELGIKELVPAYLTPNLNIQDLLTGVSFASGGSGYDPLTSTSQSVISLSDQLRLFKEYISKLNASVGEARTATIVSQTLYTVVASSNDIWNTYFTAPIRRTQYDIPAYTSLLVSWASNFLQELYKLGGRRIGVFSVPVIGCVPMMRTLRGGIRRECAETPNAAAKLFNSKLSSEVKYLNKNLPQAKFVYVDIYNPLLDLVLNPGSSGFEVVDDGCCGTGLVEVTKLCNSLSPFTCSDISKFVFWDSFHPTEKAYRSIVSQVIKKQLNDFL